MKRLIEILLFIPILIFISFNAGADGENVNEDTLYVSLAFLPDSIREAVSNKKLMIYDYGHHGKKWCLIYEDADSFNIKIGSTRNEPTDLASKIDTSRLMDSYRSLICWGLDTLPYITKNMERLYPKQWSGFYSSLSVFNQHTKCVFNSIKVIAFGGRNNKIVNEKYWKLCYLMYWLSAPDIRALLPEFNDYIK